MSETSSGGEQVYEWVAAGENSCERCSGLNGRQFEHPPGLKHAHCACEVEVKMVGRTPPRDCNDTRWSIQSLPDGTMRYGPGGMDGQEWGFNVTIECWDGAVADFEIWIDMGSDSDWPADDSVFAAMDGFAWSEIHDEAEMIAAQVCLPCSPPLVS